jgi:2-keto-4-pentenoate hydratase/2-oxohepta-3-ene-1,7-dioic acid hydratase in catechol pathway
VTVRSSTTDRDVSTLPTVPGGLVSYAMAGGSLHTGIVDSEGVVRALPDQLGSLSLMQLLQSWDDISGQLVALDIQQCAEVPGAELDIPLRLPAKLIFAGANYYAHAQEMGTPVPEGVQPFFFLKPPSTTLVPDGADLPVFHDLGAKIDFEAELGVVIGRRGKNVAVQDAPALIAGYVVVNDITDRSRLARAQPILGPAFAFDWLSAKGLDASCPISSALVPARLVADPQDLAIRLWVNGELKQNGSTSDMVTDIPSLIAAVSETMTLEPGDVIATGTPAGVGAGRGEFLEPGDVITAEVELVGRVTNRIVPA